MEYEPNRAFIRSYARSSPQLAAILQTKVDNAADYWAARARKRTGRMATNTHSAVIEGPGGLEGLMEVNPFYTKFQERGTEDIEGQHILAEIVALLERGEL